MSFPPNWLTERFISIDKYQILVAINNELMSASTESEFYDFFEIKRLPFNDKNTVPRKLVFDIGNIIGLNFSKERLLSPFQLKIRGGSILNKTIEFLIKQFENYEFNNDKIEDETEELIVPMIITIASTFTNYESFWNKLKDDLEEEIKNFIHNRIDFCKTFKESDYPRLLNDIKMFNPSKVLGHHFSLLEDDKIFNFIHSIKNIEILDFAEHNKDVFMKNDSLKFNISIDEKNSSYRFYSNDELDTLLKQADHKDGIYKYIGPNWNIYESVWMNENDLKRFYKNDFVILEIKLKVKYSINKNEILCYSIERDVNDQDSDIS